MPKDNTPSKGSTLPEEVFVVMRFGDCEVFDNLEAARHLAMLVMSGELISEDWNNEGHWRMEFDMHIPGYGPDVLVIRKKAVRKSLEGIEK